MAESSALLRRYTSNRVSRVRISPPPHDSIFGTKRVGADSYRPLGFTLERRSFMARFKKQPQKVVHRSFDFKHFGHSGNYLYFLFFQTENKTGFGVNHSEALVATILKPFTSPSIRIISPFSTLILIFLITLSLATAFESSVLNGYITAT
ncbi:MAG: hypothetical protein UU71_C0006G0004 [Parcubacteria group bacterium GW2011_GWB1_41_6]|nr:MAG: hypothetical protein UU71_C0006G0004 [Parcubacteria group bacterium GW2011_GWB1_41_6]